MGHSLTERTKSIEATKTRETSQRNGPLKKRGTRVHVAVIESTKMAFPLPCKTSVAAKFANAHPDILPDHARGLRRHSLLRDLGVFKIISEPFRSRQVKSPRAINNVGGPPISSEHSAPRLELPTETDINELSPVDSEKQTEISEDRFSWNSNWYAVQVVNFMDASRPHAVTVLGRPYVLWRDAQGEWRCFVDECPHRLVPLSEGRIDSEGRLQCSYHGWSFGSGGACESIPQAAKHGPGATASQSPRACATAVPTMVAQGILFIWPDEKGWERALATPAPLPPNTDGPEWKQRWSMRDLPYGYELLAENVVDVSHLPFAHHGVGALKRDSGKPLALQLTTMGAGGFTGYSSEDVMAVKELFTTFQAPSRYTYDRVIDRGAMQGRFLISLYITPTTPGHSRIVLHTVNNLPLPKWIPPRPHVLGHLVEQDVLDGDAFFLHAQERALQRRQADPHRFAEDYFMPTSADRFVVAYRQWLSRYAGGAVQWPEGTDTRLEATCSSREEVMDRFKGHTQHCTACLGALRKLEAGERALVLLAAVLLAVAAVLRSNLALRIALAGAAVGSGLLAQVVKRYQRVFVYTGWDHAARK